MRKGISTLFVAACAIAIGVSLSMRPWHVYAEQRNSTNQQLAEMRKVQIDRVHDLQEEAAISGTTGREQIAREHGYHRIGEVSSITH